jgi:4'-phosphopantetheinyl transferase
MLTLFPNQIHLWFVFPDKIQDSALLAQYEQLLTREERGRWQRFYFPRHRHQYLISRALARTALSRYLDAHPGQLRFEANRYGRPELLNAQGIPLRFNLSKTDGLIMCGVTLQEDIGVDIETVDRKIATEDIAGRYFSPQEANDLRVLDGSRKQDRFFQYWTLKESYIKARGMGLSLPLDQFTFHLPVEGASMSLSFDPRLQDDPGHWQCWLLEPAPGHYAAISVNRAGDPPSTLRLRRTIPLREELDFTCETLCTSNSETKPEPQRNPKLEVSPHKGSHTL